MSTLTKEHMIKIVEDMKKNIKVRDRRWYHRVWKQCFVGSDAVTYLVESGVAKTREDAVVIGRKLAEELGAFEHVVREHIFKDKLLYYRFSDDAHNSDQEDGHAEDDLNNLGKIAEKLESSVEISNRRYHFRLYKNVFLGSDAVSILSEFTNSREEAVELGRKVAKAFNLFRHVTNDHGKSSRSQCLPFSLARPTISDNKLPVRAVR